MFRIQFRGGLVRRWVRIETVLNQPGIWKMSATGCGEYQFAAKGPADALKVGMESVGFLQAADAIPAAEGEGDTAGEEEENSPASSGGTNRKGRKGK